MLQRKLLLNNGTGDHFLPKPFIYYFKTEQQQTATWFVSSYKFHYPLNEFQARQRGLFSVSFSLTPLHAHTTTQSHISVLFVFTADKNFFRVESLLSQCELSAIMMTMLTVEKYLHHEIRGLKILF